MKKFILFACLLGISAASFSYDVTAEVRPEGAGTLTFNPSSGAAGTSIRLTATANPGYRLLEITGAGNIVNNRFVLSDHDMTVTATFVLDPVKNYPGDIEAGSVVSDEVTANSIASSNITFNGTMTAPGLSSIRTASPQKSLFGWFNYYARISEVQAATVGTSEVEDNEYYMDIGDGGVWYFYEEDSGELPITIAISLPDRSDTSCPAMLICYLYENADDERYWEFMGDNVYSDWFPASQPWSSTTRNGVWEIKWKSPPGSDEWYFIGAQEFPMDLN